MAKRNTPQDGKADKISEQVVVEAMKIARATQRPGQTKEQTQLIAKGIEKGIAEYKKQHKAKSRAADKAKKQELRAKARAARETDTVEAQVATTGQSRSGSLPWILLALSWAGFVAYLTLI